jgi:hypothetical protein
MIGLHHYVRLQCYFKLREMQGHTLSRLPSIRQVFLDCLRTAVALPVFEILSAPNLHTAIYIRSYPQEYRKRAIGTLVHGDRPAATVGREVDADGSKIQ